MFERIICKINGFPKTNIQYTLSNMTRRTDYWTPYKHIEPKLIYAVFLLEITKELFRAFFLATDNLCSCWMRLCQWLPGPIACSSHLWHWVGRIYLSKRYTPYWHCQVCIILHVLETAECPCTYLQPVFFTHYPVSLPAVMSGFAST